MVTAQQGVWRGSDGCEKGRRRYWGLLHRSMIHTWQSPSVPYCGIFHLQNIFECTCIWYNFVLFAVFFSLMFWVSHLINQNNAPTFCIIRKYLLFYKIFQLAPAKHAYRSTYQLITHCCPLLLHFSPHCSCTAVTFVCGHLYDWNWDCKLLVVMKCDGSTHQ